MYFDALKVFYINCLASKKVMIHESKINFVPFDVNKIDNKPN